MAEKIKKASPYFLILVLVGLVIAFNFWSTLDKNLWDKHIEAADPGDSGAVGSSVSVGNIGPTINVVNLYGADMKNITLIENTDIDLMATITIEDPNGCDDLRTGDAGVEAWFLTTSDSTAGVAWWDHVGGGTSCSYNPRYCYDNTVVSCSYDSCAGTEVTYICFASATADGWQYYADPTDSISSNEDDVWVVIVAVSDSAGNNASSDSWAASDSAEVLLYSAIDVTQGVSDSIPYGTLSPGQTSNDGDGVMLVGIRNTGNRGTDPLIEEVGSMSLNGEDEGIGVFNTWRQQYAAFSFTTTTDGTSLSGDETIALDLTLPQRGRGEGNDDPYTSISDDQLYWGIDVEVGQFPGNYRGSVSYTATPD